MEEIHSEAEAVLAVKRCAAILVMMGVLFVLVGVFGFLSTLLGWQMSLILFGLVFFIIGALILKDI